MGFNLDAENVIIVVLVRPLMQMLRYYFEIGTTIFHHILIFYINITFGAVVPKVSLNGLGKKRELR